MSRRDVKWQSRKTHNFYLYKISKKCVGLMIFRRPWGLTNCASHGTLAKLTRPGGLYDDLKKELPGSYYQVTQQYLHSIILNNLLQLRIIKEQTKLYLKKHLIII